MGKSKKLFVLSLAAMLALSGCNNYKKFKEEAAYEVDENGSVTMTGFIDAKYVKNIYFCYPVDQKNIIYLAYYEGSSWRLYDIDTGYHLGDHTRFDENFTLLESLHYFIVTNGYELKDKYTKEDIEELYNIFNIAMQKI